ncbi:unnamed protein product [Phaeothamnion confervicola]
MRPKLPWLSALLFLCSPLAVAGFLGSFASRQCRLARGTQYDPRMAIAEPPGATTIVVVGATGYIGKNVVRECVRRGYKTVAVARRPGFDFPGAQSVIADVSNPESLRTNLFEGRKVDCVISCLASRNGTKADSWAIDHQATLNCLEEAKAAGARHFILLSAFCVRKPLLQFQLAKLEVEKALAAAGAAGQLSFSIVRPTAFMKSMTGQFERVRDGSPFIIFGDGSTCRCNAISEAELARYMVDCISDASRTNKILNIGGPDKGYNKEQQARLLAKACGVEPHIVHVPISVFDVVVGLLDFLGNFWEAAADGAEAARIVRYYALEDMLTTRPEEKFGVITLKDHFEEIAREGQEYHQYTAVFGKSKAQSS